MDEQRLKLFRVGVLVLGALIVTITLIVWFGELPTLIHGGDYTIRVTFDEAPGVTKGTPVRKSGIFIGRVTNVELIQDEEGRTDAKVRITADIQSQRRLYHNEICNVKTSLMGDSSLEFVRSPDPDVSSAPILAGAELVGQYRQSPMSLVDNWEGRVTDMMITVDEAGKALMTASHELAGAANRVSKLLDEHDEDIDKALGSIASAAESINKIIGDAQTQAKLQQAMNDLPDTLASMKATMALAETNLLNLKDFTEPLSAGGKDRVDKFFNAVDNLDEVMAQMAVFSQKLNNREGSLARLLDDRELYSHLNRAARNIDDLTRQLKPIVADARVFSDKIARHPELLGVRGALERRPGIK